MTGDANRSQLSREVKNHLSASEMPKLVRLPFQDNSNKPNKPLQSNLLSKIVNKESYKKVLEVCVIFVVHQETKAVFPEQPYEMANGEGGKAATKSASSVHQTIHQSYAARSSFARRSLDTPWRLNKV